MQFHTDGQTFKAINISGPTHNFLGIEFANAGTEFKPLSVEQVQLNPGEPVLLASEEVQKWALEGIREANDELGTNYRLQKITFVVGDSPPAEIYRTLAKRIALRLHAQPGAFNGEA